MQLEVLLPVQPLRCVAIQRIERDVRSLSRRVDIVNHALLNPDQNGRLPRTISQSERKHGLRPARHSAGCLGSFLVFMERWPSNLWPRWLRKRHLNRLEYDDARRACVARPISIPKHRQQRKGAERPEGRRPETPVGSRQTRGEEINAQLIYA